MGNILLGTPMYADDSPLYTPSLSGGSWSGTLPLANLKDRRLSKVARSATDAVADTLFTLDMATPRAVRAIALAGHNFSEAGTVRARGFAAVPVADWLTVGDADWSVVGTPTRVAADFTCDDGVPLDLIGDDDAAVGEAPFRNVTFTGDGEKMTSVRIKQGSASFSQVALWDSTASTFRHRVGITWTAGVPSVATLSGSGDYSVTALGNGVYRLLMSADGVVAANTNRFYCYPTNSTAATLGTTYFGDVLAWDAATDQLAFDSGFAAALPSGTTAEDREGWSPLWVHVLAADAAARYVRVNINDTTNPDTYVEIGRLCVTGGYQPATNFSYGARFGVKDATQRKETEGDDVFFRERAKRRTFEFTLGHQQQTEAFTQALAVHQRHGISRQLLVLADPEDAPNLMWRRTFLAVLEELSAVEWTVADRHGIPFRLIEEL